MAEIPIRQPEGMQVLEKAAYNKWSTTYSLPGAKYPPIYRKMLEGVGITGPARVRVLDLFGARRN